MASVKVLSVFGTRPEAIKMAPLLLELSSRKEFDSVVAVTAQHREMLDQVLELFKIKPDYDLNIMQKQQSLYSIVTRSLEGLGDIMEKVRPDLVLVHGDTSTAFVGALAAYYAKVPVGHVEAGLRTYDIYSPFPEEINRRLISPIAALHFCPTPESRANLARENIASGVYVCGNTAIDTVKLLYNKDHVFRDPALAALGSSRRLIFMTAHRRENYGQPLHDICRAVRRIVDERPDTELVYPMHLSPVVRETAYAELGGHDRIHLIEPLQIDDNLNLIGRSYLVLTDSGGIQEEAPALGKPVVVLRNDTERPEAVTAGTALLAGNSYDAVYSAAATLLDDAEAYGKMSHAVNPYGDGKASGRIAGAILNHFGLAEPPEEFTPAG